MDFVKIAESEVYMVYTSSIKDNFNKSSFTLEDWSLIIGQKFQYSSILKKKQKELNIYSLLVQIMKVKYFYKLR